MKRSTDKMLVLLWLFSASQNLLYGRHPLREAFSILILNVLVDKAFKNCLVAVSDGFSGNFAVFEKQKRGNAVDSELIAKLGVIIHVYLADLYIASLLCDLVNDGGDHTARAAPLCPEVYENGNFGFYYFVFKIFICNIDYHFVPL